MNDHAERDDAWARLQDGATGAEHLIAIARRYPEFAAAIARHPNATPDLVAWANGAASKPVERGAVVPNRALPDTTATAAAGPGTAERPHLTPPVQPQGDTDAAGPLPGGSTFGTGPATPGASHATPTAPAAPRGTVDATRRTLPPRSVIWAVIVIGAVVLAWGSTLKNALMPAIGSDAPVQTVAYGLANVVFIPLEVLFLACVMFAGIITATTPTRRAIAFAIVPFGMIVSFVLVLATAAEFGWIGTPVVLALAVWLVSTGAPRRAWLGLLFTAVVTPLLQAVLLLGPIEVAFLLLGHVEAFCLIIGFLISLTLWLRPTVSLRTYLFRGAEYEQRRRQIEGAAPAGAKPTPPALTNTSTMAVLALVFGFVCAPVGAVLGLLALARLPRTGERGRGLAIAGLAIASVWFGVLFHVLRTYAVLWIHTPVMP